MTTKQRFCFYFSKIIWLRFCTSHFSNAPETTWTFSLRPPVTYTHPSSCSAHRQHSTLPPPLPPPHYADGLECSWGFFFFPPLFPWKFKVVGGNVRNWTETFCLPSTLEIGNFALSNRVNLQFLNVKLSLNTAQSSLRK